MYNAFRSFFLRTASLVLFSIAVIAIACTTPEPAPVADEVPAQGTSPSSATGPEPSSSEPEPPTATVPAATLPPTASPTAESPTATSTPSPTNTSAPQPTFTPRPPPTLPSSATPVPTLRPTYTPRPTSTPRVPNPLAGLQNDVWIDRNHPKLADAIRDLPWVTDGVSDLEREALQELLWISWVNDAHGWNLVQAPWVVNGPNQTEIEAIGVLNQATQDSPSLGNQLRLNSGSRMTSRSMNSEQPHTSIGRTTGLRRWLKAFFKKPGYPTV